VVASWPRPVGREARDLRSRRSAPILGPAPGASGRAPSSRAPWIAPCLLHHSCDRHNVLVRRVGQRVTAHIAVLEPDPAAGRRRAARRSHPRRRLRPTLGRRTTRTILIARAPRPAGTPAARSGRPAFLRLQLIGRGSSHRTRQVDRVPCTATNTTSPVSSRISLFVSPRSRCRQVERRDHLPKRRTSTARNWPARSRPAAYSAVSTSQRADLIRPRLRHLAYHVRLIGRSWRPRCRTGSWRWVSAALPNRLAQPRVQQSRSWSSVRLGRTAALPGERE